MKKIFAVIGNPIEHSLSPAMHNAAFSELGIAAAYQAIRLESHELQGFFKKIRSQEIAGVNVTLPYKEKVLDLVDQMTPLVRKIGAINTVYRQDQFLMGDNTDGQGYLASLHEETGCDVSGKNIMIIGAGGAARAIAFSLSDSCLSLTILNRTLARAETLAKNLKSQTAKLNVRVGTLDEDHTASLAKTDLLINTTSCGMAHQPWRDINFLSYLREQTIVSDIVYNPRVTELLTHAQKRNLTVHYGLGMLLHQGALAFELFTGQKAPLEVMRKALQKKLRGSS